MEDKVQFDEIYRRVFKLRWLIWGVLALAYIVVYFHRVAPAVVTDSLMDEFGATASTLGKLGSVYFYVYMAMQIPAGALADTLGARKTVTAGCLLAAVGSFLFGYASVFGLAYFGRFLVGLGVSVIFVSILKIQSEWFLSREFGTLSGLTMFVGNMGAVLGATPLALMVAWIGWRYSFEVIGFVTLIVALACWLIVKNSPVDLSLPSIKEIESYQDRIETPTAETTSADKISLWESLKVVFLNKYTWPPFLVFFGVYGTLMAYSGMWGIPYLTQVYGLDNNTASTYLTTLAFGIMIGSALIGFISDKLKKRKLPFIVFVMAYIAIWVIMTFWSAGEIPSYWLYLLNFLMGFFGSAFVLTWACAKEVNPDSIAGMATGTANVGGFLGAAIMQTLFGYALDSRWQDQVINGVRVYPLEGYHFAFVICLLVLLVSVLGLLLLKETSCQNIHNQLY